ncbi:serine palmitoyltransferase subunit I [Dermatophagoides pteronyssinus]|uniref:serine palmitoyltransferase subunit I n=1 Tax=Dermatophagoides pteronyssinus TaxID=6956 RepID=UPI003F67F899
MLMPCIATLQQLLESTRFFLVIHALAIAIGIWYWFRYRSNSKRRHQNRQLTPEELEKIQSWQPEPLVPYYDYSHFALNPKIISSMYGKYLIVNDKKCLNLATHNYLGLAEDRDCIDEAVKAVKKYGVGSCGPRGFFGTVDIHLTLEQEIARFMQTEEAILYSYGYAAISSAIPAYSKSNDIIFVDEAVNFAIQQGLIASRSRIKFFKHNDTKDLERLLDDQSEWDLKNPKEAKRISRFMIVEGLYINTGNICPLAEIIRLKRKHKVRLFIDDTCSFGVLGKHGRGIVEHSGCSLDDVDMIAASLEYACASYGGFCTGTIFVIDHQRLSGLGYCFSASLPPLQAAYALKAIEKIQKTPELLVQLRNNCVRIDELLRSHQSLITINGLDISPIKHLRFTRTIDEWLNDKRCPDYDDQINNLMTNPSSNDKISISHKLDTMRLEKVVDCAYNRGYGLTVARYLEHAEYKLQNPSIRLIINSLLTGQELESISIMLIETFEEVEKIFFNGKFFNISSDDEQTNK